MLYRKKPFVLKAKRWDGNHKDMFAWIELNGGKDVFTLDFSEKNCLFIKSIEGLMTVTLGDWIVQGIKNEFYPIRHDIFIELYEKV